MTRFTPPEPLGPVLAPLMTRTDGCAPLNQQRPQPWWRSDARYSSVIQHVARSDSPDRTGRLSARCAPAVPSDERGDS